MNREEKKAFIDYMHERFSKVQTAVVADYRGLNVELMTKLRVEMRQAGVEFRVVKNTLTAKAAEGTPIAPLKELLEGPNALAMHERDPVAPAKILVEFSKQHELPKIKGGVLEGRLLSAKEVEALAKMLSREQMLAKLAGGLNAGPQKLCGLLSAPAQKFLGLLNALKDKKQQPGAAGEPQPA